MYNFNIKNFTKKNRPQFEIGFYMFLPQQRHCPPIQHRIRIGWQLPADNV